jgi:Ala-tRNA(Pro) deacylase
VDDPYQQLVDVLQCGGARYRLIQHRPVGQTREASAVRGHPLDQAAKCLVVRVSTGKRTRRYVLAVLPGDRLLDLDRIRDLVRGSRVAFARRDIAESLTGTMSGAIMPFSFCPELELVVDPAMLEPGEMFFNAGRLDRSVAITTTDYVKLARPRIERITQG